MKKIPFRRRASYWFDNMMARGTGALVLLLFVFTLAIVAIVACLTHFLTPPGEAVSFGGTMWASFMRVLDAGNLAGDYETGNAFYVILMIIATVCGLFVTSILIGIINAAFESKLYELRKGNSGVIERGHTLILGFGPLVYPILSELVISNENEKKPTVVILSPKSKEEMEDAISANIPSCENTRVICRTGNMISMADLRNAAVENAARIIVVTEDDYETTKAVLAVSTILAEGGNASGVHITAMVRDEASMDALRIAGGGRLEPLFFESTISRIIAQTCRQSGLSLVYQELFDFEGCEIYMEKAPSLEGGRFFDAPLSYANASVMGIARGERVLLNPPADTLIEHDDRLILVCEDDGVAKALEAPAPFDSSLAAEAGVKSEPRPEHMLILGSNRFVPGILREVNAYALPGSSVTVAALHAEAEDGAEAGLGNISVKTVGANIYERKTLEGILSGEFDYIILLNDTDVEGDPDARVLTLLLQLRDIERRTGKTHTIISEMQHDENQKLAACTRVNDFVIGSRIISLMMTQVCKNRELGRVFNELLTDEGSEIYIRPAADYIKTGVETDMFSVTAAAMKRGALCLGYKRTGKNGLPEVFVNPDKTERITFREDDMLIVLSAD